MGGSCPHSIPLIDGVYIYTSIYHISYMNMNINPCKPTIKKNRRHTAAAPGEEQHLANYLQELLSLDRARHWPFESAMGRMAMNTGITLGFLVT